MGSPVEMLRWQRDNAIPLEKVKDRWSQDTGLFKEDLGGKFLTGIFVDKEAPEFVSEYYSMIERMRGDGKVKKKRNKKS